MTETIHLSRVTTIRRKRDEVVYSEMGSDGVVEWMDLYERVN